MFASNTLKFTPDTRRALTFIVVLCLTACQSPPYTPSGQPAEDRWQVVVHRDGLVEITRQIILSQPAADYVRDASALEEVLLFGEVGAQEYNACEMPQAHGSMIFLDCATAYRIEAMPTQLRATLPFPDDLLPGFLVESLAYQPLGLSITQEIDIAVPGKIHVPQQKGISFSPVYASRSTKVTSKAPQRLLIQSSLLLAPGDVAQPRMQHLDPIDFDPILGLELE